MNNSVHLFAELHRMKGMKSLKIHKKVMENKKKALTSQKVTHQLCDRPKGLWYTCY